jgi:hypothetical protein
VPPSPIIIEPNHISRTRVSAATAASAIATCSRATLVERHLHVLGELFRTRLAAQTLQQQARHTQQLVDRLDHVYRETDRTALVGNRTRHRLPNPPRRVSRELEAAPVFKFIGTLEEVGKLFAVTHERIRQIEAKALRKLRETERSRDLAGFMARG